MGARSTENVLLMMVKREGKYLSMWTKWRILKALDEAQGKKVSKLPFRGIQMGHLAAHHLDGCQAIHLASY
jgi:hypothetical protein